MPVQRIGQTGRDENQGGNHAIAALADIHGQLPALNNRTGNSDARIEEPQHSIAQPGDGFSIRKNKLLVDPGVLNQKGQTYNQSAKESDEAEDLNVGRFR